MKGTRSIRGWWLGAALALGDGLAWGQPPPERATVAGTVTDRPTGRPLRGAQVTLYRMASEEEAIVPLQCQTTTDEQGQFRFPAVEEGTYSLSVSAPEYLSQSQELQVEPPSIRVEIALDRLLLITGRVVDPTGQPVRNAPLSILSLQTQPDQPWPFIAANLLTTDGRGAFRFSWGTTGSTQWLFLVPNVGYGVSDPVTVLPGKDVEGLEVALREGVTLRVRLVDEATQQPLSGIQVQLQSAWGLYGGPLFREMKSTDATGLFTLGGLMPGLYVVQVTSPVVVGQPTASVLLFPGQAEEPTLLPVAVSPEAAVVSGRIIGHDGQTPAAHLSFTVYSQPGDQPTYYGFYQDGSAATATATDSEGRYRLYWGRPGPRRFVLRAPGMGYTRPQPVLLLAGKETPHVDLQLRPLASMTVVLQTEKGEPVAGGQIQMYPGGDGSAFYLPPRNYQHWEPMATGADGTLHLADLIPGTYNLSASAPGRLTRSQQVHLQAGGAATVTLRLPAGLTVTGRLRAGEGQDPVADAEVRWASLKDHSELPWVPEAWNTVKTDAQGGFRLGPLAPDQHYLWVYAPNRGWAWSDRFEAGPEGTVEGLELVLQPGGTLAGIVWNAATGQPLPNADISLQWVFFAERTHWVGSMKTDAGGRFTQNALPPGEYWVQANPPGGGLVQKFLAVVRQGQTTALEIPLAISRGEGVVGTGPAAPKAPPERKVRVVGPDGVTPLPGAEINPGRYDALLTDATGQATLKGSGRGNRLTFQAEGFTQHVAEVTFPEDGTPATVVLRWRGGTLAGQVVRGDTGQPAAEAMVWAVPWLDFRRSMAYSLWQQPAQRPFISSDFPQTTTDARGSFRLEHVMEDEYVLGAFAEGFLPTVREGIVVREGAAVEGWTLILPDPQKRRLAGRILGPEGQPLREVDLTCQIYQRLRRGWWSHEYRVSTDAEGCYSLQFPEAGSWTLCLQGTGEAAGLNALIADLEVSEDQPLEPRDITLQPSLPGTLAGRVLCPDGVTPAVGVKVAPFPARPAEDWWTAWWTGGFDLNHLAITDAEGRFAWPDLPPDTYGVCAPVSLFTLGNQAVGWQSAVTLGSRVDSGKVAPEVTLRYRPGGELNVRVVDAATGEPPPQPRVQWNLWSAPPLPRPPEIQVPELPQGGLFHYPALHPGLYDVYAWAEGYAGARETVAVRAGEATEVTLRVTPVGFGALTGRLTLPDGQTPAVLTHIYLERLYTDDVRGQITGWDYTFLPGVISAQAEAITDTDGKFAIPKREAGRYHLIARKAGYVPLVQEVQIVADQNRELNLALPQGGRVAGRVLAADGQTPAAGKWVLLTAQERRIETLTPFFPYNWPLDLQQTYTAADGTYCLEGVPPGRWWAFVFDEEVSHGGRSDVVVKEGEETAGIDFRLLPLTGEIAGVVRGPEGTPLQEAFLRLTHLGDPWAVAERYTDADGKYCFGALTPGTWMLYCAAGELASQVREVQVAADTSATVDFTLTPGGTLAGRFVSADGTPIAGAWIATAAPDTRRPSGPGRSLQGARSGADGSFVMPSLAPGRYTLFCSAPGYVPRTLEEEAIEGSLQKMGEIVLEAAQ